ncbi:MAG: hypothetical protein ACI9K2_006066 [Myxococcota bacterium]|jgi:hypothetical protein
MLRRILMLLGVAAIFLGHMACLEGFERLITTVRYDPYTHLFEVERTLENIDPLFFGCRDAEACVTAMESALSAESVPLSTPSLAERLVQRLRETGAGDVQIRLERDGDRLDIHATYSAKLGTRAAEDTLIQAEFEGVTVDRGNYRLVVAAQEGMVLPDVKYTVRKQSTSGAAGVDWREFWVLPVRKFEVTTELPVSEVTAPLFAAVSGLGDAVASAGWFGATLTPGDGLDAPGLVVARTEPAPLPAPSREPVPKETETEAVAVVSPAVEEAPDPAPTVEVAAVEPPDDAELQPPPPGPAAARATPSIALWPDPDPESPAKVYRHEARITGPIALDAAEASAKRLVPLVQVCYQRRHAERPELAGHAFLNAVIRGDGFVVSTSVYGEIDDRAMLQCLEKVVDTWAPPVPTSPDGVGDVTLPFTFRVEEEEGRRRREK